MIPQQPATPLPKVEVPSVLVASSPVLPSPTPMEVDEKVSSSIFRSNSHPPDLIELSWFDDVHQKPAKVAQPDNWEHETLQRIFRVSLQPFPGGSTFYLEELARDLQDRNGRKETPFPFGECGSAEELADYFAFCLASIALQPRWC